MKLFSVKSSVIVLLFIGVLVLSYHFYSATLNANTLNAKQLEPEASPSANATAEQQIADKHTKTLSVQSVENRSEDDFLNISSFTMPQLEQKNMRFEDDWCFAAIDLDENERRYYDRELKEFALARGQIRLPHDWLPDMPLDELGQYLLPYLDATTAELDAQIDKGNEFAMLVALSRDEYSLTQREAIAQRLVTKGHTGNALTHLVIHEIVDAEMEYKKHGVVNTAIEASLHRMMAYIAYGIEYGDLSAAHTYLSFTSTTSFPLALRDYLTSTTTNNVSHYVDELNQIIEKARSKHAITLPTVNELPKAAKHQFESRLARLYIDFPAEMESLQLSLATSVGARLTPSDCVKQQITFFSELEQRFREHVKSANLEEIVE